jgi:hypothetical protein
MASFASTRTVGADVFVGSPVGRKNLAAVPPATVPSPPLGPLAPEPLEPFELSVQAASEAVRRRRPVR